MIDVEAMAAMYLMYLTDFIGKISAMSAEQLLTAAIPWIGSVSGLIGAYMLAKNNKRSRYGWLLFLLSNVMCIAHFISTDTLSLLLMQIGFLYTSLVGIKTSFYSRT